VCVIDPPSSPDIHCVSVCWCTGVCVCVCVCVIDPSSSPDIHSVSVCWCTGVCVCDRSTIITRHSLCVSLLMYWRACGCVCVTDPPSPDIRCVSVCCCTGVCVVTQSVGEVIAVYVSVCHCHYLRWRVWEVGRDRGRRYWVALYLYIYTARLLMSVFL